jgi:hypothetical protein
MWLDFFKREKTVKLDPETLAALDEGIRSEQQDRDYSWEEVKTMLRKDREKWLQESSSQPLA